MYPPIFVELKANLLRSISVVHVVRPHNPAIPGKPTDRTGSAGILRRAIAEIRKRFDGVQAEVLAAFDRIQIYAPNDVGDRTIYGLSLEQMAALNRDLQATVARWIAADRDPMHVFWWDGYVQEAAQLGAGQSVANLTNLSTVYAAQRTLDTVIYSRPYQNRVAMSQIRSYEHWTGTAAEVRAQLSDIIGRAVVDGKNPKAVRTEIMTRLGVSRARAARFAQTDITGTLREARWQEADHAETEMSIKIGMLWTSALLQTTRAWHASRNGSVYTTDQVRAFYEERGNRYQCHCGQTECLLDADGKPILTKKLQSTMANEKKAWQSEQPTA
ncbi:MAG: hypothetical protein EON92_14895 [Burkholderiales bacterium]|nr:MAG: hypothetical protein EON92_14895 [Burkholderiales bacterium]